MLFKRTFRSFRSFTFFFFFIFPTIFGLFLFLVTLRFYAGGGFPIVAVPGGCSLGGKASSLPPSEFHDPDIHSITHSSSCAEALFTHSTRQPAASVRLFHFHCNVCALLLPLLLPALSHLSQRAWSLAPWQLPLRERASSFWGWRESNPGLLHGSLAC